MKQVSVNVTKDMLDEAIKEQVKELEKEIKKLKSQNAHLKKENADNKELVIRAQTVFEAIRDAGFFDDCNA